MEGEKVEMKDPKKEEKKRLKELEKQQKLEKLQQKKAKQAQDAKDRQIQEKKPNEKKEKKKEEIKENKVLEFKTLAEAIEYKRDLKNMNEVYNSKEVEQYWDKWWSESGFFKADEMSTNNKTFTMVVPPPNVTGQLHIGHGLTGAVEDSIVRRKRMQGYNTCYLPGLDHAGIATQSVVEKQLWNTHKLTKHDLGRDKMLEKIWEWKQKNGDHILNQFRKLGMSLDWDRLSFTMDEKLSKAVTETFVNLYERDLIYRADRLVNWCCRLQTAISEIEVDYIDIKEKTWMTVPGHDNKYPFGYLVSFAYKVKGSDEEIVVATTRLETMLGDVAVAVNSKDKRYQHLVGKHLQHPFIQDRQVIVVVDDSLVDMDYGTGAVKITPAHDPNDYECGLRHNLPQINILNEEGLINANGGQYQGMKRFEVRVQMEKDLKQMGLYRGETVNPMRLGLCSRSKDIIEPMLKAQWYVNCQTVKQRMLDCVANKELNIHPVEFEKNWFYWINGLKDWCISRQIWWGHRCPAYKLTLASQPEVVGQWIIARTKEEAILKVKHKYGQHLQDIDILLQQDEDVLDTWFSSALFPFSPFGWPDENDKNYKAFYPNQLLETGHDILFFWVARMVMMGFMLTDQLPFKHVFLHPIVRDAQGKKMSKSTGNVIDPLEVIEGCDLQVLLDKITSGNLDAKDIKKSVEDKRKEFPQGIPQCGSDALRYGLLSYMLQGLNINLDLKRVIGYKQFCNKIWNSCKFVLRNFPKDFHYQDDILATYNQLGLTNQWVLHQLNIAVQGVNQCFDQYDFGNATIVFHNFFIYDFCDVYIEATKVIFRSNDTQLVQLTTNTLFYVLQTALRLLHPMMPFLTEELYQKLPSFPSKAQSITIAQYPQHQPQFNNPKACQSFDFIFSTVKIIRQSIAAVNIPNSVRPNIIIQSNDQGEQDLITNNYIVIQELAKIGQFQLEGDTKGSIVALCSIHTQIFIDVKDHIKLELEIERLEKKINMNLKMLEDINKKMNVPDYNEKVPKNIQDQNKQKYDGLIDEKKKLDEALKTIQSIQQ